ncbi:tripartite tricarboxylate transporter TctB family protein [Actinomycetes bacterium KLBMP 9797]
MTVDQSTAPEVSEQPDQDGPPTGGPVLGAVAGAIPVALGAAVLWYARSLGFGSLADPGPGLWPSIVAALLVVAGAVIAVRARVARDTEAFTRGTTAVVIGAASLAVYTYLFELVGFEIPTVLLLALWLRFLGGESWRVTAVISVLATVGAYALFIIGLGVPLPHLIGS